MWRVHEGRIQRKGSPKEFDLDVLGDAFLSTLNFKNGLDDSPPPLVCVIRK